MYVGVLHNLTLTFFTFFIPKTPLLRAATDGTLDCLLALLKAGAEINVQDVRECEANKGVN